MRIVATNQIALHCKIASAAGIGPLHFRPAVAQRDRAVEYQTARPRLRIETEIPLPLELHGLPGTRARQCRFEPALGQNLARTRVEIGGEIRRIGVGASEQLIIEPDLATNGVSR